MRERNNKSVGRTIVLVWVLCAFPLAVDAQSFNSGSTGVDGDLIINTPGVTTYTTAPQGGGNIYNFKTIQISTGSTLRLSGAVFPNPLYFPGARPSDDCRDHRSERTEWFDDDAWGPGATGRPDDSWRWRIRWRRTGLRL